MNTLQIHDEQVWAHVGLFGKTALVCSSAFVVIGIFGMGSALPGMQADFAGHHSAGLLVQVVGGIVAPVFAIASPVAGRLVSRFGIRAVYLVSLVLVILAGLAPIACASLYEIVALRILLGLGVAGSFTAGMAGIARLPGHRRHLFYGLISFVGGIISILVFPMVGALARHGWRIAFLAHLLLAPLGLFALGLPRQGDLRATATSSLAQRARAVSPQLLLLAAVAGWGMAGSSLYSPFLLGSIGTRDPSTIGNILGIASLSALAASGCYPAIQRVAGTKEMLVISLVLSTIGCAVAALSGVTAGVMIGLSILSAGLTIFNSAGYAAAAEGVEAGGDSAHATGMISLALYLPQIFFPMMATAIGGTFGPARVYILLAVLLVLALVVFMVRPPCAPAVAQRILTTAVSGSGDRDA